MRIRFASLLSLLLAQHALAEALPPEVSSKERLERAVVFSADETLVIEAEAPSCGVRVVPVADPERAVDVLPPCQKPALSRPNVILGDGVAIITEGNVADVTIVDLAATPPSARRMRLASELAVSGDGKVAAGLVYTKKGNELRKWQLSDGKVLSTRLVKARAALAKVRLDQTGGTVAVREADRQQMFSGDKLAPGCTVRGASWDSVFGPVSGDLWVVRHEKKGKKTSTAVAIVDPKTCKEKRSLAKVDEMYFVLQLSRDEARAVLSSPRGTIVFDVASAQQMQLGRERVSRSGRYVINEDDREWTVREKPEGAALLTFPREIERTLRVDWTKVLGRHIGHFRSGEFKPLAGTAECKQRCQSSDDAQLCEAQDCRGTNAPEGDLTLSLAANGATLSGTVDVTWTVDGKKSAPQTSSFTDVKASTSRGALVLKAPLSGSGSLEILARQDVDDLQVFVHAFDSPMCVPECPHASLQRAR